MTLRIALVCLWLTVCGSNADAACMKLGMKLGVDQVLENGLLGQTWDTNGDNKIDLLTLRHSDEAPILFYIVDEDKDNNPDKVYIDRFGDCKLVLYQDLTIPHDTGLNFQHPLEQQGRDI